VILASTPSALAVNRTARHGGDGAIDQSSTIFANLKQKFSKIVKKKS